MSPRPVRSARRASSDSLDALESGGRAGSLTIVDALGCDPVALRSVETLGELFAELVRELELHPLHAPLWHVFPDAGGVTGFVMLRESHLACHTFPETRLATIDLHCCRSRPAWDWSARLALRLGATDVRVRMLERGVQHPERGERQPGDRP